MCWAKPPSARHHQMDFVFDSFGLHEMSVGCTSVGCSHNCQFSSTAEGMTVIPTPIRSSHRTEFWQLLGTSPSRLVPATFPSTSENACEDGECSHLIGTALRRPPCEIVAKGRWSLISAQMGAVLVVRESRGRAGRQTSLGSNQYWKPTNVQRTVESDVGLRL